MNLPNILTLSRLGFAFVIMVLLTSSIPFAKTISLVLFVIAGITMLALPGQGILTILIGISLMNFPGKRKLELRIIGQHTIYKAVNWIRAKAHKPPLQLPPEYLHLTDPAAKHGNS